MNNCETWTEETYKSAEDALSYHFSDRNLLLTAFTHSTYAEYSGEESNERLEFLGDAVLQLVVTEFLVAKRKEDEGTLTNLRKQYVSGDALSPVTERMGLMRFLRYSGGENNLKGKPRSSLFEAVAGAIYLDGGLGAAKAFLSRNLEFKRIVDYKTMLQEYVQDRTKSTPVYVTEGDQGNYESTVSALGKSAAGRGESKKAAEKQAAKNLYDILVRKGNP